MKRTPLAALAIIACVAATTVVAADAMTPYGNARFSYFVSYPARLFTAGPESDNSDGRVFKAKGSSAEIRVWGAYNALDQSPAQMAAEIEADCLSRPAAYRVAKAKLVAVSCDMAGGTVLYEKHLIHGDTVIALRITYPASESTRWKPVVERVSASLRAGLR